MKILLIFFTVHLIAAVVGDINVTGYSGRSLLVDSGKSWFSDSTKYMAKIPEWRVIINDMKHDKWINEGRFNLFRSDDGNLMILIRDLNTRDAGRYAVEVNHNWRIYMALNVIEGSCCVRETLMVNSGDTSIFSCEYPHNHINNANVLFKELPDSVKSLVNTTAPMSNEGRFSVYDDRQNNLFSVRITAVTPDDGGVYLCGVWIYRHLYSYSIINTVHLNIMTKVSESSLISYSGAGLVIKCENLEDKTKPKYICKESAGCSAVQEEWMKNGDVSVHDDTRAGVLMVFFRELKAADAGTYRCGVKESEYTERFTQLQLSIKHDAKYPEVLTESVDLGGEVNISCQIPEEQNVHFCKEDDHQGCQIMRASEAARMNPAEPVRVFTVSISNVSVGDAGVYWCGAETRDTHLTFISLITKIHLNLMVKKDFSMILIISVCVVVLLIAGFTLTVCKSRHKRPESSRDPGSAVVISADEQASISSNDVQYAAVSFQKHEESLNEAAVDFRKDELHCDYTTVSHLSD